MKFQARVIEMILCCGTLLASLAFAQGQNKVAAPVKEVQTQTGPQSQNQVQASAASDPKLRASALKITLGPPKRGPKMLNPHAATHDAAIIATLQMQRQAAEREVTQLKVGIHPAGQTNVPPVQSQSHSQPAPGAGTPSNAKSPVPVKVQKSPAAAIPTPGTVSPEMTPGMAGGNPSLHAPPRFDATIVTCAHDPTFRILRVTGDAAPATFTPIDKYNLYTISGCSFGSPSANNKVYLFGTGSFQGNFVIRLWSENYITMALDPALSGFPDLDNLTLVVQRGDSTQASKNGFKFYAARGDALGNPVPLHTIPSSQFSATDSQFGTYAYSSPSPDSATTDPLTELRRLIDLIAPSTTDTFHFENLFAGFYPASASMEFWTIGIGNCAGIMNLPNPNGSYWPGYLNFSTDGQWDINWGPGSLVVKTQVDVCGNPKGMDHGGKPQFASFSQYAIEVWVLGPRCLDPWTGQRDQACVDGVRKQLGL